MGKVIAICTSGPGDPKEASAFCAVHGGLGH